jgi:thiosulfate reductase cytochrome b subunit
MQLVWFVYAFWLVLGLFLGFVLGVIVKGHYSAQLIQVESAVRSALKTEEQDIEGLADKVAAKLKARAAAAKV